MAQQAVRSGKASIKLAGVPFSIRTTCYRYQPKLSSENAEIADLLIRLTHNQRNWGFGLCILYRRNVKGHLRNHQRVYRTYRELARNRRIKPRQRIVRKKPQPLAVPESINPCWSMDFMRDQLSDGRCFRIFHLIDDVNREALAMDIDLSLSAATTALSTSAASLWTRLASMASGWNTSSLETRRKMPMLSGITEQCDTTD